jgi:hypothetical protein
MSILKRYASPQAPAAEWRPHSDRLRVITAGRVGNMEARLGASGFDVVAVAETENALIDAVSADEPDAIIVEADLCPSLEHVRDLAPDAVLIVVGDHTPAGALGRIERGVSGTAMAGLLHALVADGVGAAVVWGLVPAFGPRGALQVPERMSGSLLSAKADLVRAYVANALGDHVELVTAASTVAVTVSASLVLTLGVARTHERPERVLVPAPAVSRAPQHPVVAVSPTTRTPAYGPSAHPSAHGPSRNEGEPGDRLGPNPGQSGDHGRHDDQDENQDDQGEDNDDQGENEDDQGEDEGNDDQGKNQDNDDQGEDEQVGGHAEDDQVGDQGDDDQGGNEQGDDQASGRFKVQMQALAVPIAAQAAGPRG